MSHSVLDEPTRRHRSNGYRAVFHLRQQQVTSRTDENFEPRLTFLNPSRFATKPGGAGEDVIIA